MKHFCETQDKRCDRKTPERGQRLKCGPVDDAANETGQSECDYEWESIRSPTAGWDYIYKECYGKCKECAWYYTNGGCSEWKRQ